MFKMIFIFLNLYFLIYLLDCNEIHDESATKLFANKTIFKHNGGHPPRGPPPQQQQPPNIPPPQPYNYQNQNVRMPFQPPAVQIQPGIAQPPPPPPYDYAQRIIRPIQEHRQQQQHNWQPQYEFAQPGAYQYWHPPPPAAQIHYPQQNVQLQPQLVAQQRQRSPEPSISPIQNYLNQQMSNYDQTRLVAHFQTHNPIDPLNEDEFRQAVQNLYDIGVRPHVIAREYDMSEQTIRQYLRQAHSPPNVARHYADRQTSNEMRKYAWDFELRNHYPNLPVVAALSAGLGNPPTYPTLEGLHYPARRQAENRYYAAKQEWRQQAMFGAEKRRRNQLSNNAQDQVAEFYEQQNPEFATAVQRPLSPGFTRDIIENPLNMDPAVARGIYELYQYGSLSANYLRDRYFGGDTGRTNIISRKMDAHGVHLFQIRGGPGFNDQGRVEQAKQALLDHLERSQRGMSPRLPPPVRTPELQQQMGLQPQAGAGTAIHYHPNQFDPTQQQGTSSQRGQQQHVYVQQQQHNQPSTSGGVAHPQRAGQKRSRSPSPAGARYGSPRRSPPRGPAQIQGPPGIGNRRRPPPRSRSRSPAGGGRQFWMG